MGRDGLLTKAVDTSSNFNSHARVGRDGEQRMNREILFNFNSHARVGRDMAMFLKITA